MNRSTLASLRWWMWTILSCALISTASAQDAERYAPKTPTPEGQPGPSQFPSVPTAQLPASDAVFCKELKGLRFIDSADKVLPSDKAPTGISFDGTLLSDPAFIAAVEPMLGKPVSLNQLNAVLTRIVQFYRDHDRPVVDAALPEQEVTTGVVQIVVIEGHAGKISIEGNRYFSSDRLTSLIRLQPGDVIRQQPLLEDLDWINANPFRRVDLTLQRGGDPGTTDLLLHAQDRFPLRLYSGYENTGTQATGENRWLAGFNWGDAFGLNQQLSYQFTMSNSYDSFNTHWASYIMQLPWRHTLTLMGSYTESSSPVAGVFDMTGRSWQASARYDIPLPWIEELRHSLQIGFDFKQSNNNLDFGGTSVFNSDSDIAQWSLGYLARMSDDFGQTTAAATLFFSPGNVTGDNNDRAFDIARPGAQAQYVYAHFQLERTTNLPLDLTHVFRAEAQLSDGALLGSEQLGFGGMYSVRGYHERQGNGDQGFILSNELRTPPISLASFAGVDLKDQLQFLAFFDYGQAYNRGNDPSVDRHAAFASVGPGLRYDITSYLSVRYDYGFRLISAGDDRSGDGLGRHHLSIVASWTF